MEISRISKNISVRCGKWGKQIKLVYNTTHNILNILHKSKFVNSKNFNNVSRSLAPQQHAIKLVALCSIL